MIVLRDQIKQGIVESVPNTTTNSQQCHYLSHHAVICNGKTTAKLHVIYDASVKVGDGLSLNDCLCKGQSNQLILNILLRFLLFKYGLTADLEKPFLQISMIVMFFSFCG